MQISSSSLFVFAIVFNIVSIGTLIGGTNAASLEIKNSITSTETRWNMNENAKIDGADQNSLPLRCDFCSCFVANVNVGRHLCRTVAFVVETLSAIIGV